MSQQVNIRAAEAEIATCHTDLMSAADKLPAGLAQSLREIVDDLNDLLDDIAAEIGEN